MAIWSGMEVALAVALALAQPVAAPGRECIPLDIALQNVRATHPYPIVATVTLDAEQSARVVEWYNTQPPASPMRFNLVVMARHQDNTVGLLLGNDGMICIIDVVAPKDVPAVMHAILGDRI